MFELFVCMIILFGVFLWCFFCCGDLFHSLFFDVLNICLSLCDLLGVLEDQYVLRVLYYVFYDCVIFYIIYCSLYNVKSYNRKRVRAYIHIHIFVHVVFSFCVSCLFGFIVR